MRFMVILPSVCKIFFYKYPVLEMFVLFMSGPETKYSIC